VPAKVGEAATPIVVTTPPSNGVAAVLSLFLPGAGQMYKGHVGMGIAWLIIVVIGYVALIVPGLILHLICILQAASATPAVTTSVPMVTCVDCQHVAPKHGGSCPQCGHVYGTPSTKKAVSPTMVGRGGI
jgi:TM2 domain-containing membrane protein YozV